jgi:hypothetical protein
MNDLLFAISIISSILWSAGFFAFKTGNWIHAFLVIAVVSTVAQLMRRRRSYSYSNKTLKF